MAKAGREDLMFQFMSAFEATFPQRQISTLLLKMAMEVDLSKRVHRLNVTQSLLFPKRFPLIDMRVFAPENLGITICAIVLLLIAKR